MKLGFLTLALGLLVSVQAFAAPSFKIYEVTVPSTKQAIVLGAIDKFMNTEKGKSYKGSLHVNAVLANGVSPTTHTFVLLMDSMADIAEWENSLPGNPDIMEFWTTLEANATPVDEYMGSLIKTWGDISNEDRIWQVTRFYTTDPLNMLSSMDKMFDDLGKKFPGQTGLHALPIGNRNGANNSFSTHMLVNGFKSVAELEEWQTYLNTQPAWGAFLSSVRSTTTWQGTELVQNVLIYDDAMDLKEFLD
jgi:hypothetical protein